MRRTFRRFAQWLVRLLLRVGLLPASTRASSDTMGEWKRIQAEKDDPRPGLVLPDPNAPHAALIRRVRLYAQNGAKALAPLLDRPLPRLDLGPEGPVDDDAHLRWLETGGATPPIDWTTVRTTLQACRDLTREHMDDEGLSIVFALASDKSLSILHEREIEAIHAAYNSPWTVIDGEVYEYESETKRRIVQ